MSGNAPLLIKSYADWVGRDVACYVSTVPLPIESEKNKKQYQTYEQNQCRGEPYVRPPNKNRYQTYQGLSNGMDRGRKGDVYDFMLLFNPYIEIFLQEIKTFREKHKIIDVPFSHTDLLNRTLQVPLGTTDNSLGFQPQA
ncbi:MAG: hypothetical protein OMM_09475, partial [Candidatus Magnetoglobus multicellularis str. Araruama]